MMEIREVGDGELDACAEVIRRSFKTVADEFGLTEEKVPTNGVFIRTDRLLTERAKGFRQFGLFEDGVLCGYVQLERADASTYYLEKLAVVPECRHKGYGRALLGVGAERVREAGASKIGITIIEENERLKNWYIKNGYIHTGTKIYAHLPFTVGFLELYL